MTGSREIAGRPGLETWLQCAQEMNLLSCPESGVTGFNSQETDGLVQKVWLEVN